MIVQYLDYLTQELLPQTFRMLNSLMITDGVSVLGFSIAICLLCIVIGAFLTRV